MVVLQDDSVRAIHMIMFCIASRTSTSACIMLPQELRRIQ